MTMRPCAACKCQEGRASVGNTVTRAKKTIQTRFVVGASGVLRCIDQPDALQVSPAVRKKRGQADLPVPFLVHEEPLAATRKIPAARLLRQQLLSRRGILGNAADTRVQRLFFNSCCNTGL